MAINGKALLIKISFKVLLLLGLLGPLCLSAANTSFNLLTGGLQRLDEGLQQGVGHFLTDWKTKKGALEIGSSLAVDMMSDVVPLLPTPYDRYFSSLPLGAALSVNSILASRMLIPSYQTYRLGKDEVLSPEFIAEVQLALQIFGGLNKEEIANIKIKPLNEAAWELDTRVCDAWLGILATNKILFVDEGFLTQFRKDPLMYGFLLSYGISHYSNKSFMKRATVTIVETGLRSALSLQAYLSADSLVNHMNTTLCSSIENRVPSLAVWQNVSFIRAMNDSASDANRSLLGYGAVQAARIAWGLTAWAVRTSFKVTLTQIAMGVYDSLAQKVKNQLFRYMCTINPALLGYKMSLWLNGYNPALTFVSDKEQEDYEAKLTQLKQLPLFKRIIYVRDSYLVPFRASEAQRSVKNEFRIMVLEKLIQECNKWAEKAVNYYYYHQYKDLQKAGSLAPPLANQKLLNKYPDDLASQRAILPGAAYQPAIHDGSNIL